MDFLQRHGDSVCAVVLDIMMPPGTRYELSNTDEGLRTGLLLFQDVAALCPGLAIVVLTNVSNQETLNDFPSAHNLEIVQKMDMPPSELPKLIDNMIVKLKKTT